MAVNLRKLSCTGMKDFLIFTLLIGLSFICCAQKTSPTKQATTSSATNHVVFKPSIERLPESNINIPVQISLRSLTAVAESNIDNVYTSPDYPNVWIMPDCATRYVYHFRRSPLKLTGRRSSLLLSFIGLYKIIGSTRICVGSKPVSPWTPACKCGFNEGERKVNISFAGQFFLQRNYLLKTIISNPDPKPINKCTVCFWGQDITGEIISGLKKELILAKKAIEDSFGIINLRPYLQQVWDRLNTSYAIPKFGYIALQPKQFRMENFIADNDLLTLNFGITATPQISFVKPNNPKAIIPDISGSKSPGGFNIHLEAALQYDSLSRVVNGYLINKRFDLMEGILKRHVIVKNCKVYGDVYNNLIVEVEFSGSHNGTVYLTGKPEYNENLKKIDIQNLDFDLQTKDFLLKTAKWLFNKQIVSQIKRYTSFELTNYYATAAKTIDQWLNKEWAKGISGSGKINDIRLTGVYALPEHLLIRSNCIGNLKVTVTEINLKP
ncbi:MAG: DUF4403 family protein [Chitinophagaceae bacterium]